jgi:hypothetical protein
MNIPSDLGIPRANEVLGPCFYAAPGCKPGHHWVRNRKRAARPMAFWAPLGRIPHRSDPDSYWGYLRRAEGFGLTPGRVKMLWGERR